MSATEIDLVEKRDQNTRRCIVTGDCLPREALLRFVIGPGDEVVPDLENRLPGRGLWLFASWDVVNTATKKGSFSKAARRRVHCPEDLADRIGRLLTQRCLDWIGLSRRAGLAVAGHEKAANCLRQGRAALLLIAADAGDGDGKKMRALATGLPVIDQFDSQALGRAWGREKLVYVALTPGSLTRRLVDQAQRLATFGHRPEGESLRKND